MDAIASRYLRHALNASVRSAPSDRGSANPINGAIRLRTHSCSLVSSTRTPRLAPSFAAASRVSSDVSVDTLLEGIDHNATHVLAFSDGDYTTNLPLEDVSDGKAWVAFGYDGEPLAPEHGGPARLLVPHLYFWKSAKWVRGLQLMDHDEAGFWESYGYHMYGDPWREQRYAGD